jgi:hypothetical protein
MTENGLIDFQDFLLDRGFYSLVIITLGVASLIGFLAFGTIIGNILVPEYKAIKDILSW